MNFQAKLWRLLRDPDFRRDTLWHRFATPTGLFQPYGDTAHDRYPDLFGAARALLDGRPDPRLLSFGCSTGAEVFTLRHYFPQAHITGLDINPHRIAICRRRLREGGGDQLIRFEVGNSADTMASASFDAIFCLAVFRHGKLQFGPAPRCDPLIRFSAFEQTLSGLARCLKPGGLLVLCHDNFRLQDTDHVARRFTLAAQFASPNSAQTPLYGRDNRLLPGAEPEQAIYRLTAGPTPEALT
jgi:SAM-dependent methyltransferase